MCYYAGMADDDGVLKPREVRVADLTPENLRILIKDIGGPGYYPAADLYRWYVGMAREVDSEPVTKRKFGVALTQLGYKSTVQRKHGKPTRCWVITRRAEREE